MSKFVLTAQLQLQAPNNVSQVVSQIQNQLNNVSVNVQVQGAAQANQQLKQITQSAKNATSAASKMGNAFAVSIRRFAAFSIATRAVGLFTGTLSEAVQTAIDFERELVKISQVTGRSISSLRDLTDAVTGLSTNLGVTSQSLLEVTTILTQAGLSSEDTKIALESLAKAALAPNFDSIQETAEGAIAILAQFQQGVGALEGQLSSIDAVAGAFAVEAGDLIDVIRRSGGVFKASGGSLNELLALFTSVRATTRESAESIGTGLRTIFTRIQRPETIEFLKQFGVELVDLNGKFVGPYEAIRRLSEALSGLGEGDLTFISIAEELGGFRQIGKVLPLLQQFSTAQAALNVAQSAGNGLTKNAESAQLALAVRIAKVREEFLALIRSMTETPTFQIMANAALSLASALIKIADSIKPLLPLLGAVAAFKAVKGIGSFVGGISAGLTSGKTFNSGGKVHAFATGGLVPGSGNRDTVPAMLTPGEFVMRKSSVQKLGANNLARMNNGGNAQKFAIGGKVGAIALNPIDGSDTATATITTKDILSALATNNQLPGGTSGNQALLGKSGDFKDSIVSKRKEAPDGLTFKERTENLVSQLAFNGKNKQTITAIGAAFPSTRNSETPIETSIKQSITNAYNSIIPETAKQLQSLVGSGVTVGPPNPSIASSIGVEDAAGKIFEGAVSSLGAPFDANNQKGDRDAFDFPRGIGSNLAQFAKFKQLESIPTDAKKSLAGNLEDIAYRKTKNYLAGQVNQSGAFQALKARAAAAKGTEVQTKNPKGPRRKHFGGIIQHFATGGTVEPDDDTAKLSTEFGISQASAQRIGHSAVDQINIREYAIGGKAISPQQKRVAQKRKIVSASGTTQLAHFGGNVDLTPEQVKKLITSTNDKKLAFAISEHAFGEYPKSQDNLVDNVKSTSKTLDNSEIQALSNSIGLEAKRSIKLELPSSFNQALRRGNPDLVAQKDLVSYIANNPKSTQSLKGAISNKEIASKIASTTPKQVFNNIPAYDVDDELNGVGNFIARKYATNKLDFMFKGASRKFVKGIGLNPERSRKQDRVTGIEFDQQFASGGLAKQKDTLQRYFEDSSAINLGLSSSKSLSKDDRKSLATDVRNLRQLRSPVPEEVYSSISRNAFDKFAMDTGLNKNPEIPKNTKFNNRQTYYAQEVAKITGKTFSLPGFVSTSKNYTVAKSFLDNAPRSEDNWAAMLTVKTKKNAQGIDVAEQLKDRKINITKQDINPRTGKMDTFFMKQPSEESEVMLSPRSKFRVNTAKYVDLMGRHNLWANVQQLAIGGRAKGIQGAPLVDDILQVSGSILPKPSSAIQALINAGGGAVDIDRTIKRTIGDKAFGSAKTDPQRNAALQTYFRDDTARLRDVQTAPLTQFGQELQSVIKSGKLNGRKVSIISKSKRVPGIAEYLSQVFGIPSANMVFTAGQSKEPAMEAIRSKGPRVERVKRFFGGIIPTKFALGGMGKASRKVDYEAGVGPSPFMSAQSKKLGQEVYSLQKFSGLTSAEFDEAKRFADMNGYNIQEFKTYLTRRAEDKKRKSQNRTNVSDLLNTLRGDNQPQATLRQTSIAQQLSGPEITSPNRQLSPEAEKLRISLGGKPRRFASGGLVPGVGNSDTVPAVLQQGDFVIRKSSVSKIGVDNLASMAGYATGGGVDKSVPALLTPGEFVFSKSQAQSIGYSSLNRMNKVGKYAKGGVVQRFANGGTATGGNKYKSVVSNIPVPGFDTKAPTLLNSVVAKLTGTFSTLDVNLKQGANQFKLLQKITPDLAKNLMDYANAANLNVKQTGQLASAYSKLVNTMLTHGYEDAEIVAGMQPYADALKADTNAKLNSAKSTVAMTQTNATASKFPALTQSGSPQKSSSFPQLVTNTSSSQQVNTSTSVAATSANTTAISSNTQAQKSAAQSAMSVVSNNKMFAASMATSLIGGFLPAVDENSGAILRVTQSLFSMTTAVFATLAALEAMNISLNKQTLFNVLDLISGKGGAIASKVGQFAGNALGGTKVGGMIAPMGNLGGGLGAKAVQTSVTQAATAIGGIVGPLVGATAAFFAIQTAGNTLTEAFMNYEGKLKKARESGNIEGARKIATEQQSSKTAVNMVAGTVSGAIVGSLLTPILGPLGVQLGAAAGGMIAQSLSDLPEYSGQVAATQAASIKAQESLAKASENASKALSDFEKGNISVTELLQSTSGAANDVASAKTESNKLNAQSQKEISREGDFGGLRGGLRNVVTLGGLLGESTVEKQARIESEQQKSRADVSKKEKELITSSQPALNALSGEIAAAGGTFTDVMDEIYASNPNLYFALLSQGSGDLSKSFDNIKKEVDRAREAFNAINLGMQNVQGAAAAAALGVSNYVAAQQAGNIGLEQSLAVLEASVTSAAQGISDADFGKALDNAESTLRGFGANDDQINKFRGNISSVNEVQKNQSSIFEGAREKLASDIRNSRGAQGRREAFTKAIEDQLKSSGYDDATIKRFKEASANMSDDQLKKIGEGDFTAFEESINELGKKTMEQVNGPLKAAIEIQKQLNELTKQRIEAERQLISAQLEASNVRMEAMDIAAKYGGPKVTPEMRAQNIAQQANIQTTGIRGVTAMKTGSASEIATRNQQLSRRQAEISGIRMRAATGDAAAQQQLQGESGTKLADEEKRISEASRAQIQSTRDLIKSKEEELRLIKEKNQLERSSIDALVSGDIDKFFEQQAAVGAQAAIATGDQSLINQFGMSAIGAAAQETRRMQESGVQELYGQQLSGPGGLTERAYGSAISAAGIQNPLAMAQVAAGSTGAEAAIEGDIRDLASTMGPTADIQVQAANNQLKAAQMQLDAARAKGEEAVAQMQARQFAKGGVVYANRGMFVPRGTDTVPAMLTPGEFVVRREAVQRNNNLSILQAMNKGVSSSAPAASSQSGDVAAMATGGIVRYRSGGSTGPEPGGAGISSEALNAFASALSQFNTELTKNIQTLANTKFQITLSPTNINVNLTGTSFLANLTASIKQDLLKFLGQEISNYSVGNDGKLRKTGSTLGTVT